MILELYDNEKPITVQNFLKYIANGRYTNAFAHRLIPNFVLQGGGFCIANPDTSPTIAAVQTYDPIVNEFTSDPKFSNVKGTITMAKVSDDPNSATSQWFLNLKDNNTGTADSGNLDLQNGGFTVFGRVISGLDVMELFNTAFTNAPTSDPDDDPSNLGSGVYDASDALAYPDPNDPTQTIPDMNFTDLPLLANQLTVGNLIFTDISVVTDPVAVDIVPILNVKGKAIKTTHSSANISGTSSGVTQIEWRIGTKGNFHQKSVGASWKLRVTGLKPGTNFVFTRGVSAGGSRSAMQKVKIIRK